MGIFNIFKKKTLIENTIKENKEFKNIELLFKTPLNDRNEHWIKDFNTSIKQYNFSKNNIEFFEDTKGMNYLNLSLDSNANNKIWDFINFCLENGVGISINGSKQESDWIFTFGELLDYQINGTFYSNEISKPFTGQVIDRYLNGEQATIGQPSTEYFPDSARLQIKNFLATFGLENIKIALIWWRENNRLTLAFEIIPEMFKNSTNDLLNSLLHYIKWYLPNHYDVIFIEGNEDFKEL